MQIKGIDATTMISELKIISKNGIDIYSSKSSLLSQVDSKSDADTALFAGFISAILSISREIQQSEIRELVYKEHKIIFVPTENLVFLGFANQKVVNSDVENLLKRIISKFLTVYEDKEYSMIPTDMTSNIENMINSALKEEFWWLTPTYNLKNNFKLIKNSLINPSGTYYITNLPNTYILTGFMMFLVPLYLSYIFGTVFTGFGVTPEFRPNISKSLVSMLVIWLGTPMLMELLNREKFQITKFLIVSGIFFSTLSVMMFISGHFYQENFYLKILDATDSRIDPLITVFLFSAPLNLSFFFYIVITGYSGSFVNNMESSRYYVTYVLCLITMISIAEVITT